jgi:hypothetical protein
MAEKKLRKERAFGFYRADLLVLAVAFVVGLGVSAAARPLTIVLSQDSTSIVSLRGAILHANRNRGFHTIVLTGKNYTLGIGGADDNSGLKGDLDITGQVAIVGKGENVTIDATGLGDRIFHILPRGKLSLSNVTIKGGTAPDGVYASWSHVEGEPGGGILNQGSLTLIRCRIIGNSSGQGSVMMGNAPGASGGAGGGIYSTGVLSMKDCTIQGNSSGSALVSSVGGNGGGLYSAGLCIMRNCTVSDNNAGDGGGADVGMGMGGRGGDGGGIYNAGKMLLANCTLTNNASGSGTDGSLPGWVSSFTPGSPGGNGGNGGAVFNAATLQMNSCAVIANTTGHGGNGGSGYAGGAGGAGGSGPGVFNAGNLTLNSCTLELNQGGPGGNGGNGWLSSGGEGGPGGNGEPVVSLPGAIAELHNCITALNEPGPNGTPGTGSVVVPPVPPLPVAP